MIVFACWLGLNALVVLAAVAYDLWLTYVAPRRLVRECERYLKVQL